MEKQNEKNGNEIELRRKKKGKRTEKKKDEIEHRKLVEEEDGLSSILRFGKLGVFKS